jgi:uncharacterized protein (DUF169 family)
MATQTLKQLAENIGASLALNYPAVSVAFTNNGLDAPLFSGSVPAGCVFWQEAFQGPIKTSASDHGSCSIGLYTHNFATPPVEYSQQLGEALQILDSLEYVRTSDVPQIPTMIERHKYVLYSPLDRTTHDPAVVLLFANSRQGLVIAEAVQQVEGSPPPVLGRPACAVIPQTVNSGRAAMSLGCCGARAYLETMTDDIAIWALPGPRIGEYADRIVALAKANDLLRSFHQIREGDVKSGARPTYQESLARMTGNHVNNQ